MRKLLCLALMLAGLPMAAKAQSSSLTFFCGKDQNVPALAEKKLAETEGAAQAAADKAAAQPAIGKIDDMRKALDGDGALPAPYDELVGLRDQRRKASDPVLAELYRRVALDQFARLHLIAAASRTGWAEGLSPGATSYAFIVASSRDYCGVDESNTAWLEKQIDARGWFKATVYGPQAAGAAFLLAQHADLDKPFQKKALALMEPLLKTKDVRPQDYALLFDRVAVGEGRPQRYGSQGGCVGHGEWREKPVEDAATLDQTRASVGLEPMAAYRARFTAVCA
jgi:hypothetical protein